MSKNSTKSSACFSACQSHRVRTAHVLLVDEYRLAVGGQANALSCYAIRTTQQVIAMTSKVHLSGFVCDTFFALGPVGPPAGQYGVHCVLAYLVGGIRLPSTHIRSSLGSALAGVLVSQSERSSPVPFTSRCHKGSCQHLVVDLTMSRRPLPQILGLLWGWSQQHLLHPQIVVRVCVEAVAYGDAFVDPFACTRRRG